MDLLVDPVVFALPLESEAEDAHLRYVQQLSAWSGELCTMRHNFFASEVCMLALYEAKMYPSGNGFRRLWERSGETDIGYVDALNACRRLMENIPYLEDRISGLRNLEIQESNVNPDLLQRLLDPVACAFRDTLGLVAYARDVIKDTTAESIMLVTHPIEGGSDAHILASVSPGGKIFEVSTSIPMLCSPDDLLDLTDLEECWQETRQALQLVYRRLVKQRTLKAGAEWATYHVAQSFNESILQYHYNHRSDQIAQIFRKCVLLLTDNLPPNRTSHHWLDKKNQRIVNGWGAWRLHITGGPIAIRLHYWRRHNKYILMQVGPHENFDIDDPPEDFLDDR
jgi:hypothetical protein